MPSPGIGGPIAFQSPSIHGKVTSKPHEIQSGERRWYVVGYSERDSQRPMMISKEFTIIMRSEPYVHDVDGACQWCLAIQKVRERFPNFDLRFTSKQRLEQLKLGSNRIRFETCWYIVDDSTPASFRAIQGRCSGPSENPECFKHVIQFSHGWTNVIYHSSSQQYLAQILLTDLIVRGMNRKAGRQACYFSAAHPQQSRAVPSQRSWKPQIVLHVQHKWHTDTFYEIDLVKAQELGLQFYQTFSCAVVDFGDIPAEGIARVVGHDQTILYERPSEFTQNRPSNASIFPRIR